MFYEKVKKFTMIMPVITNDKKALKQNAFWSLLFKKHALLHFDHITEENCWCKYRLDQLILLLLFQHEKNGKSTELSGWITCYSSTHTIKLCLSSKMNGTYFYARKNRSWKQKSETTPGYLHEGLCQRTACFTNREYFITTTFLMILYSH